jgi:hypothetical protein
MDHNNSSNTLAYNVGVINGVAKEKLESWTLYISQGKKIDLGKVSLKVLKTFWKTFISTNFLHNFSNNRHCRKREWTRINTRGRSTLHWKFEDVKCNWNLQPHKQMHKILQNKKNTKKCTHEKNIKIKKRMQTNWTIREEAHKGCSMGKMGNERMQ